MSFVIQNLTKSESRLTRAITRTATLTIAISTTGTICYSFLTRDQTFQAFDDTTDPLAQGKFGKAFNPHQNLSLSDIYVARVPISQVRHDLIDDHAQGGSGLIRQYCTGLLGGWAFAAQRQLALRKARKLSMLKPGELFSKEEILESNLDEGTSICKEFVVIEKTPASILFRGGSSSDGNGLREVEVLMQGLVDVHLESGFVVFKLKCMFFSGQVEGCPPPLPRFMIPLHLIYAKALAANGVANCRI